MNDNSKKMLEKIIKKNTKIAIWGCGVLGTTNLVYIANSGYNCLGIDVSKKRIEELRKDEYNIMSDKEVLDRYKKLEVSSRIKVTDNWKKAVGTEYAIHIVCIPTEKNGESYADPLKDVINKITCSTNDEAKLIIIESTIVPEWINTDIERIIANNHKTIGKDVFIGSAPRRDLFGDKNYSLKNTNRVIGGNCQEVTQMMKEFYKNYCDNIIIAKDHKHAMLSKVIENLFRFQNITLANEINVALQNYDVTHILELSGTKWNMETYHPSIGIGGYCIPLAAKYFCDELAITNQGEMPKMIDEALKFNEQYIENIFEGLQSLLDKGKKVGILGISYIPNIKVTNGNIAVQIIKYLEDRGYDIGIHDPVMTYEELIEVTENVKVIKYPYDLINYDIIIVVTDHDYYKNTYILDGCFKLGCQIVDNQGTWRSLRNYQGIDYFEVGSNI